MTYYGLLQSTLLSYDPYGCKILFDNPSCFD